MSDPLMRWEALYTGGQSTALLHKALWYVAYSIGSMLGEEVAIAGRRITSIPTDELVATAADPEAAMIAIYLLLGDALPGQVVLMVRLTDALALVDRLLEVPPGTTTAFGEIERSVIGELGNLCVSSFLNVIVQPGWGPLYPSPPAVMVDLLETILDAVASSIATAQSPLVIIDTTFTIARSRQALRLWIIPDAPLETTAVP